MPHLVEMHKKHANKGLVVIAVSLDDPAEEDLVAEARKFLKQIESPFINLHLNEPQEAWSKKLGESFPPFYYIFDRRGKWVRYRGADYKDGVPYPEMDKLILKMLDEK